MLGTVANDPKFAQAEAIFAGRADSGLDPEIITGLQRLDLSVTERPVWHDNPRFSHHFLESSMSVEQSSQDTNKGVQQQLATASTIEEAASILQKCFSVQLAAMLQVRIKPYSIPTLQGWYWASKLHSYVKDIPITRPSRG